ncbi:MAG: ankyrin repeat domain-containing protein [Rickettsiales endosymbiont of Dermacentor nuttalli]
MIFSVDVNIQYNYFNTSIYYTAINGHTKVVDLLLQHGPDINQKNYSRRTALHIATGQENYIALRLLINKGADLNSQDTLEKTALHYASRRHSNS